MLLLVRMERRVLKVAARAGGRGADGGLQRFGAWPRCRAAFAGGLRVVWHADGARCKAFARLRADACGLEERISL